MTCPRSRGCWPGAGLAVASSLRVGMAQVKDGSAAHYPRTGGKRCTDHLSQSRPDRGGIPRGDRPLRPGVRPADTAALDARLLSPPAQEAMNDLYHPVVQNGRLSRRLKESLLVAASDARVQVLRRRTFPVPGQRVRLRPGRGTADALRRSARRLDRRGNRPGADCRRDHIRPAVGDAGRHCRAVPPLLVRRRDRRGAGHGQSLSLDDHGSSGPAPRRRPGNTRIRRLITRRCGIFHRSPAIGTALPCYRRGPARPPRLTNMRQNYLQIEDKMTR